MVASPGSGRCSLRSTAAADEAPGGGEEPQPQPLGFPGAGGSVEGEHLHPDGQFTGMATSSHHSWFWPKPCSGRPKARFIMEMIKTSHSPAKARG